MVRRKSDIKAPLGEVEEGSLEDLENVDTLITELEVSRGRGNIIICVVNSPLYRDRIIKLLKDRFIVKVINVKDGNEVIQTLKEKKFDDADVLVWIMPEEPEKDILNALNNFRELFYDAGIPSVIFYNTAFSEEVIREAPDFWRYRGNFYEFREEGELPFMALEYLTTPLIYKSKEELEKRKEINEYLLDKATDKKFKAEILNDLGLIYYHLGELDKALEYFMKALEIGKEIGYKKIIAAIYLNIGNVYRIRGELDTAIEYYNKALKMSEELGHKYGMAISYLNIGNIYSMEWKFDRALEYYNKAIKIGKEIKDKEIIAAGYTNIGNINMMRNKLDKAMDYYNKAMKICTELGYKEIISVIYANIGDIYNKKGELDKAIEYYNKAIELDRTIGDIEGMAIVYRNIGGIYLLKGELDKALEYYNKALELFNKLKARVESEITSKLIDFIYKKKHSSD